MARRSKFGRFQVWNQAGDSWKHTDQAYNLDILDQMLGGPTQSPTHGVGDDFNNPTTTAPAPTNQWLSPQDTTQITNFGNRTLYNIVRALDHNDVPLGAVFAWWRPSTDVPLPGGCVPADGSTYTGATQHSYVPYGLTSITVPDLRNAMILGAYETATNAGATALNRDGTNAASPSTQTPTDGPGIRATGGTNVPRNLAHVHSASTLTVASHAHTMGTHIHDIGTHSHGVSAHQHFTDFSHSQSVFVTGGTGTPSGVVGSFVPGGSNNTAAGPGHTHGVSASGVSSYSGGNWSSLETTGTTSTSASQTGNPSFSSNTGTASPAVNGNVVTALSSTEILGKYVGLLYMVKIRKDGPLHNTVFSPGP